MYEDFGARVDGRSVQLSLFLPDSTVDPSQYEGDGDARIHSLQKGPAQPVADLRAHLAATGRDNVTLTLERMADNRYDADGYGVDTASTNGAWTDLLNGDSVDQAA